MRIFKMPNNVYSLYDRVKIIKLFYSTGGKYRHVAKEFNENNPTKTKMSPSTVHRLIDKFEATGCVDPNHAIIKHNNGIPEESRIKICELAKMDPNRKIKDIAYVTGLSTDTVRRVLKKANLFYKHHRERLKLADSEDQEQINSFKESTDKKKESRKRKREDDDEVEEDEEEEEEDDDYSEDENDDFLEEIVYEEEKKDKDLVMKGETKKLAQFEKVLIKEEIEFEEVLPDLNLNACSSIKQEYD